MNKNNMPVPPHFRSDKVGQLWRVEYERIASAASEWAQRYELRSAGEDEFRICLILVDVQNTFCIPDFELFVAGRSGRGAVDDNIRLAEFIYRNLHNITEIFPTMDTHQAMQIFHSIFFVDEDGNHPEPYTQITVSDIEEGKWRFNDQLAPSISHSSEYIRKHLLHYTRELRKSGKYDLTIWPYHAMLGGLGHALVSSIEEAIFFHTISRYSQPYIHIKGDHPLTEHYSVLRPEVSSGPDGKPLSSRSESLFERPAGSETIYQKLTDFDAILIAGQAKSHCVSWTISDLLHKAKTNDNNVAEKIYILEDCTSCVVIPGVIDYTDRADEAFKEFSAAGMNIVRSTDSISSWPGIDI